ncbi:hypothetical protein BDV95DRAFT_608562 [Massariosphaeria phaeospora]|uniref:CFEM domain-containing protein n=1 Tax=Massariosphaeria phaeospora TaxID=100035 RepID=A0A7C8MCD7_9PLEO|nr:hypothetical protein BDV95DRAFT_608562 [Massariosphaeria phaeospora]
MKTFATTVILALTSVVVAQYGLDTIPSCALSCFLTAIQGDGCPSATDFACHCKKADSLVAGVLPCVESGCSPEDQQAALSATSGICGNYGVQVPVPQPGPSSALAQTSAAPETSAPAETVPSTAASMSSEAAMSSMMSSVSAHMSSAHMSSAIGTGTPIPTGNGTGPGSPTPTPSEFVGAAARATQAVGVIGAAAFALLVL